MSVPVSYELWVFLWSICGGIAIAFIFDIFRIKRRVVRTGIVVTSIEDLLYWVFAALIVFFTVFLSNEGQIRGYTIIGCVLGAIFYLSAISPIVLHISVTVINLIIKCIKFVYKIISIPIKIIIKVLRPVVVKTRRNTVNASRLCITSIKNGSKLAYSKGKQGVKKLRNTKIKKKKCDDTEIKTDI